MPVRFETDGEPMYTFRITDVRYTNFLKNIVFKEESSINFYYYDSNGGDVVIDDSVFGDIKTKRCDLSISKFARTGEKIDLTGLSPIQEHKY